MDFKLHVVVGSRSNGGKFLVLKDGTIIAGPCSHHQIVWIQYCKKKEINYRTTNPDLIGAGQFNGEGVVTGWASFQYLFVTPQENKEEIQELIRNNIAQILAD